MRGKSDTTSAALSPLSSSPAPSSGTTSSCFDRHRSPSANSIYSSARVYLQQEGESDGLSASSDVDAAASVGAPIGSPASAAVGSDGTIPALRATFPDRSYLHSSPDGPSSSLKLSATLGDPRVDAANRPSLSDSRPSRLRSHSANSGVEAGCAISLAAERSRTAVSKTESHAAHYDGAVLATSASLNSRMINLHHKDMNSVKKKLFSAGSLDTAAGRDRDGCTNLSVLTASASAVALESVSSQMQPKAGASAKEEKKITAVKHPPLTKEKLTGKSRGEGGFQVDASVAEEFAPSITGKAVIPKVSRAATNLPRPVGPKEGTHSAIIGDVVEAPSTKAGNKLATLPKQQPLQSIVKPSDAAVLPSRLELTSDRPPKIESVSSPSLTSDTPPSQSNALNRNVASIKHDGADKTFSSRADRGGIILESAIAAVAAIEREQVQRAREITSTINDSNPFAQANDSILHHRILEAQAMNRKGDEQGATMHKFSLWNNVKKPPQLPDPASSEDTIDTSIAPDKKSGRLRGARAVRAELEAIEAKEEQSTASLSRETAQPTESTLPIETPVDSAPTNSGTSVENTPSFVRRPSLSGSGGLASALRNMVGSAKLPTEESVSLSPYDAEDFSYLNTRGSLDSLEEGSGLLSPFEEDGDLLSRATSLAESLHLHAMQSASSERDDEYTTSDFEHDSKLDGEVTTETGSSQTDSKNMSSSTGGSALAKNSEVKLINSADILSEKQTNLEATMVLTTQPALAANQPLSLSLHSIGESPSHENNFALVEKTGLTPSAAQDGTASGQLRRPEHGKQIPWVKGETIGQGTFGRVYRGLNESTGELLAVKQIYLVDGSEKEVESLRGEIRLMKSLSHKNIVRYLGTSVSDRYLFIIMEYVPGGSISSMLGQFGAFSEPLVRRFIEQILFGVEYLHGKGIIHRDIKGANILVNDVGVAKLADFGCSKKLAGLTTTSLEDSLRNIMGSVPWMAPEVIKQSGHGRSADIWSVGATVVEMVTGKHPWHEFTSSLATLFHVATSNEVPPLPSHISPALSTFMHRCLVLDPKERATASQLLQDTFVVGEASSET